MNTKATESLPLFLQDGGEEKLAMLRKELKVFCKCMINNPRTVLDKTFISLNPASTDHKWVGEEAAKGNRDWWLSEFTQRGLFQWIMHNNHKVNGKFNGWSSGFLGSRWCDMELNGKTCRIAFYSRKTEPESFPESNEMLKENNYILMIDPTM